MATTNSTSNKSASPVSGPRRNSARPSWWWLTFLPLLVAIPFLFRPAGDAEQDKFNARRRQIETMSASERERLEQNFERFQKLPSERKAALREIDETVAEDEDLKTTLLQYGRWLSTLTPWERAELRKAETIEEKLQYVSTIAAVRRQKEHEKQKEEALWADMVKRNLNNFQGPGQRPGGGSRVSDNDLSNMMAVLEAQHASRLKSNQTASPGSAAYDIQLLAEALKASIQQHGLEQAREKPLPAETMRKMIEQIPESDTQALFKDWDSKTFVTYLAGKLETAWWNEARRNPPSPAELDQTAKMLGGQELEDFESKKESEPLRAYYQLLMATRFATFNRDRKELNSVLQELDLRKPWRPKGGPFGGDRHGRDSHGRDRDHRRDDRDGRGGKDYRDNRRDHGESPRSHDEDEPRREKDESGRGERKPSPPPSPPQNQDETPLEENP